METQCSTDRFSFQPLGRREVVAAFDGGTISSDAGGLLLREVEKQTGILRQFASCFVDHRDAERIEHTVQDLVASGSTAWRWGTRTSTITTSFGGIPSWPFW